MASGLFGSLGRIIAPSTLPAPRPRQGSSMGQSLRASARVDTVGVRQSAATSQSASGVLARLWQMQAWSFYDEVGESHYAASFLGACLSRCLLTIGLPDDDGHIGPAFDAEGNAIVEVNGRKVPGAERAGEALALIRALRSEIGGQPQMLRTMGINLTVAGEFHLVGSIKDPDSGIANYVEPTSAPPPLTDVAGLQWEVLSTEEFRPQGDDYVRRALPGATPKQIRGESVHAIRIWRSHPRWSELPDSSMRPVMDILEELSLLTREVRGETLSRIPNGQLLLIPDEIEYPDDDGDDSMGEAGDPFTRDLINTMSTAITDKSSAAQTVPLIFRAPAELLKEVRTLDLRPNRPSDSMEKRSECVRRFAQGIDLPVEVVTGHQSTTFSNAVQIDDSLFKSHVEPVLEIICDALTAGYLRPAMGEDMPFVVHYDSSELVARPNRAQDAKDLHDRWAVANASLRSAAGFSDSDAPSEEEIADRIRIQQLTHVRQTIPTTPQELQTEDQPSSVQPGSAPGAPIKAGPLDGNNTDKPLAASIQGAAEVATEAAIVRAGARLRTKAYKMDQIRAQLSQVPNAEVPVSLGPSLVERFSDGEDLFHGQFDPLWNCVVRWTGDQNYANALRDACMGIALRRMYQPRQPFPFHDLPDYEMRSVVAALDG